MKKILISANPWQIRVAVTRNGELQNIYFASHAIKTLERSFFKGIVIKVLPGIQTAFVDIGQEKAGFLHISEIDRELALKRMSGSIEVIEDHDGEPEYRPNSDHRTAPDINKILREGEPILVQVNKEPVYEKGAKLTTCFTLPGRFIVLMPNIPRIAISKKIENREERMRLKEILGKNLPHGMGAIIRTTSEDRQEKEIVQDVQFLVETWNTLMRDFEKAGPKEKIYEDIPLALQIVRDHLDDDVEYVVSDSRENQRQLYSFIKGIAPEYINKVRLYEGKQDLFEKYGIDKQLQEALAQKVNLQSGGSIIIETTQAMTVVDVNTGKYTGKSNLEETILKTNLEAAEEIARQLRLRNIGGLIVIDFIDMTIGANRQKLFKFFEKILKERDKFQSVVLKVSEFGLVQMTRKRSGKTLQQELTIACACCKGLGHVISIQTECYALLPKIKEALYAYSKKSIVLDLNPQAFEYISNTEYNAVLQLEKDFQCRIVLSSNSSLTPSQFHISIEN